MRIMVATDGSDAAGRALDLAARLAKQSMGDLKIVHVISVQNLPMDQLADYARWEHVTLSEVLNTFAEEKLTAARQRAEALGAMNVQTESIMGEVSESILDVARRDKADMVILGKRGRGRLSGLVLGSVSQKVVCVAPCVIVVVP